MRRAPFQVLVYPFIPASPRVEFALLRRSDAGWWQGVAGGGEDEETPLEAARREAMEEAGISPSCAFVQLDTVVSIRAEGFADSHLWGQGVYVIPQYAVGVEVPDRSLVLSREHSEYRWLGFEEAHDLCEYDGNRTALWELNQRLSSR